MKKELYRPDFRKKYRSDLPPSEYLKDVFGYDFLTGELWFLERPREHFKTEGEWLDWNQDCPQPVSVDKFSKSPMRIYFTCNGEFRGCYAPEIIFALLDVEYSHHWPIVYRDGNSNNLHLLNIKIVHPEHKDADFGFQSEFRDMKMVRVLGTFPTKDGKFSVLAYEKDLSDLDLTLEE